MSYRPLFLAVPLLLLSVSLSAQNMTLEKLKIYITEDARVIEDRGSMVEYEMDSIRIYLITDVASDRMRFVAGVAEESSLTKEDYKLLLEANFDRALDAKYALSDGVLWSVFVHPLSDLTPYLIKNGLYQVRNLVYTYGSTYTSTGMVFGEQEEEQKDKKN